MNGPRLTISMVVDSSVSECFMSVKTCVTEKKN
jgi:hypothetical protein